MDRYAELFFRSWQEVDPKQVRKLKQAGVLEQRAMEASDRARDRMARLISGGMTLPEAQEIVLPDYSYPPEE